MRDPSHDLAEQRVGRIPSPLVLLRCIWQPAIGDRLPWLARGDDGRILPSVGKNCRLAVALHQLRHLLLLALALHRLAVEYRDDG